MDPALIGAGAKVIGALGGIFGKKPKTYSPMDQASWTVKGQIQGARDMGLHGLAGLGASGGYNPAQGTGTAVGDSLQQAGDALQSYAGQKADAGIIQKQKDLIDAQILESRSRTMLNAGNARRTLGDAPSITGLNGGIEALDKLPSGGPRSVSNEPQRNMPARQQVTLGGRTMIGPNPEAFETGLSELIAGALIYGPQWMSQKAYELGQKLGPDALPSGRNRKVTSPPQSWPYGFGL